MTKAKKTTTKAKAEAKVDNKSNRVVQDMQDAAEQATKMFSGFADGGMKDIAERASASTEMFRTLGARNLDFFSRTLEQGVAATQALTAAKDPRAAFEIQSGFAKSFFSSYQEEVSAQAELCMSAMKDAAKPFMARTAS